MSSTLFDISIKTLQGEPLDLSRFKDKKIIFVNVASHCGYTSQYSQLQELYENFKDKLEIIGLPCNDFGNQEPGSANEIIHFCQTTYKVTFLLTEKIGIIVERHPLYSYLCSKSLNSVKDIDIKWNFHKILINPQGVLFTDFPSSVSPLSDEIIDWIQN